MLSDFSSKFSKLLWIGHAQTTLLKRVSPAGVVVLRRIAPPSLLSQAETVTILARLKNDFFFCSRGTWKCAWNAVRCYIFYKSHQKGRFVFGSTKGGGAARCPATSSVGPERARRTEGLTPNDVCNVSRRAALKRLAILLFYAGGTYTVNRDPASKSHITRKSVSLFSRQ